MLGAARGLDDETGVDLDARQLDPGCRPVAHEGERSRRRQRPDPDVLMPVASTAAPAGRTEGRRLRRLTVEVKGVEVRRLRAVGELDAEAEAIVVSLIGRRSPPATVADMMPKETRIELVLVVGQEHHELELETGRIGAQPRNGDGGAIGAREQQLEGDHAR